MRTPAKPQAMPVVALLQAQRRPLLVPIRALLVLDPRLVFAAQCCPLTTVSPPIMACHLLQRMRPRGCLRFACRCGKRP